jgi:hypothetical protein
LWLSLQLRFLVFAKDLEKSKKVFKFFFPKKCNLKNAGTPTKIWYQREPTCCQNVKLSEDKEDMRKRE